MEPRDAIGSSVRRAQQRAYVLSEMQHYEELAEKNGYKEPPQHLRIGSTNLIALLFLPEIVRNQHLDSFKAARRYVEFQSKYGIAPALNIRVLPEPYKYYSEDIEDIVGMMKFFGWAEGKKQDLQLNEKGKEILLNRAALACMSAMRETKWFLDNIEKDSGFSEHEFLLYMVNRHDP